jgi:hypothetical protein
MSWLRAILSGLVIVLVAFGLLVFTTDLILSDLTSLDRSRRVLLASVWFIGSLVGLLWALRRLQQRRII